MPVKSCSWLRTGLSVVCVGVLLICAGGIWAGEKKEWTRDDLVAALERGPGPSKGPATAPVVMVYFTDFQCGYCRKFVKETLPKLEEQYITSYPHADKSMDAQTLYRKTIPKFRCF
jgi:hypothetical protein